MEVEWDYHGCGREFNTEKMERYDIKAVGKNILLGRGEGDGNFGEEN